MSCLRLVQKTSSTGYKQDSWARLPAASGPPPEAPVQDPFSAPSRGDGDEDDTPSSAYEVLRPERPTTGSLDLPSFEEDEEDDEPATSPIKIPPAELLARKPTPDGSERGGALPSFEPSRLSSPPAFESPVFEPPAFEPPTPAPSAKGSEAPTRDMEEGVARSPPPPSVDLGTRPSSRPGSGAPAATEAGPESGVASPWDEGPSRTSVITIEAGGGFDAVPDPTPLPTVDRDVFFNRGDPSSRDEIVNFLQETGDLPRSSSSPEIADPDPDPESLYPVLEEPVEAEPERLDALPDGLATEPATSVREVSPDAALGIARDRFQLHDFQGVLDALDTYPLDGQNQTEVRNMLAESRANLLRMYEAKIGPLDQIPEVLVSNEEVIWLNLNHRAGFILSQVDGTVSYEDLISLSGMPRLDTVRILTELLDQKVIAASGG